MPKPMIRIISSSVRQDRRSHRLALFFRTYLRENNLTACEILDLQDFDFPIFEERLQYQKKQVPQAREFAAKIKEADGLIIVTPEYNGAPPASLKNAIDLLTEEWRHKSIAICTVSAGAFGGSQALLMLQFSLWKLGAVIVPAFFPVPEVEKNYTEDGRPLNPEASEKRAKHFVQELLFFIRALKQMKTEESTQP